MAKQSDDFDVLTFFIYVMALLTAIVGGFAGWNWKKVTKSKKQIKTEIGMLKAMEDLAVDPDLKTWIASDRESASRPGGLTPADFQALMVNTATTSGLSESLKNLARNGQDELRSGAVKLTYRLTFQGIRVENLIRFLSKVEEDWPGARTAKIVKLDFNAKTDSWDTTVDLTIFTEAS